MDGNDRLLPNNESTRNLSNGAKYLRPKQAAEYCGVSESTLAKLRMQGRRADGPKFARMSGCVVYRRVDLDEWIDSHMVFSQ
ncbi:helix-turn-helix domain-containing protein [Ruegeria sp. PrR005]|uniref:Helix-turn-helix domain-containing protein n=1 Tax=Ruegeria sp. PrR005 TaxID=2706882 RepID=A0A6B2NPH3_9RHOB|nr:helix-turn-helix domain-containing protein [Ruegeria sp. PrR005]